LLVARGRFDSLDYGLALDPDQDETWAFIWRLPSRDEGLLAYRGRLRSQLARYMSTSVDMLDRVYGHLEDGAEQVARAKLDAAAGRAGG
jgi:hypothetical protein